jgi:hypothetical protein
MSEILLLIWAGNKLEGRGYIARHKLVTSPNNFRGATIITPNDVNRLRGLSGGIVIRVGTWHTDKRADEFTTRLLAGRMIIVDEACNLNQGKELWKM